VVAVAVGAVVAVSVLITNSRMPSLTDDEEPDVEVLSELPSPSGSQIATGYILSGGGAAGYVCGVVSLRNANEPFRSDQGSVFQSTRDRNPKLTWVNDQHLNIEYAAVDGIIKQERHWQSVAISYQIVPQ
jgi:hypothetical protein